MPCSLAVSDIDEHLGAFEEFWDDSMYGRMFHQTQANLPIGVDLSEYSSRERTCVRTLAIERLVFQKAKEMLEYEEAERRKPKVEERFEGYLATEGTRGANRLLDEQKLVLEKAVSEYEVARDQNANALKEALAQRERTEVAN